MDAGVSPKASATLLICSSVHGLWPFQLAVSMGKTQIQNAAEFLGMLSLADPMLQKEFPDLACNRLRIEFLMIVKHFILRYISLIFQSL
ncbi:Uncharacterised protein [Serratia fonticola]|nr:Uncharacterised protein [Serratia fonticola]